MDQTAPQNQIFFRHRRECRQESDLDRHLGLCACGDHQKTTQYQDRSLHNFTDFEPHPVRENSIESITYGYELQ